MKKILKVGIPLLMAGMMLASCGGNSGNSTSSSSNSGTSSSSSQTIYTGDRANGVYDYTTATYQERLEILGKLESYALKNHLAGIPLYDDSSSEQFSERCYNGLPSKTYITNFGFGVGYANFNGSRQMYNGEINEAKEEWKDYFHSYTSTDSGTFNYWNSTGADVADRNSMITASYFEVDMNDAKTDYKWTAGLSKTDEPIMLDADGNVVSDTTGKASKYWRVKLKTGDDGIKYAVPETSKWYSKYNGAGVKLEDYLTPFKTMMDNRYVRSSEMGQDSSGFEGVMEYMYGSKDWSKVGIQLNEEEGSIDFEFITAKTMNYARTSLSSSLYSPVPSEFLTDIGGADNFGKRTSNSDYNKTLDNIISCGPYVPTYWQDNQMMAYKKNDLYYNASKYHFAGLTEKVYSGTNADKDAYKAFLNNELDEVTIPTGELTNHGSDKTVCKSKGSTVIKLNVNSCSKEEWEYYFGENGTIYKHKEDNYWAVKPIMSNDDFLTGCYFAINRESLAETAGRTAALGYLSNAYTQDPDAKEFWRDTEQGKAVLEPYISSSNEYGYSVEVAQQYFNRCISDMIASGKMKDGQKINLTGIYRYQDTIDNIGKWVKSYIEDAFNKCSQAQSHNITLTINLETGGNSYTDAYTKMDHGEYDFAEGAISGNVLNPLEFMSTVCTDDLAQGFCLNWGDKTAVLNEEDPIIYDDKAWSYDALWSAANASTVVEDGVVTPVAGNVALEANEENSSVDLVAVYPGLTTEDGDDYFKFKIDNCYITTAESVSALSYIYTCKYTATFANGEIRISVPVSEITSRAKKNASSDQATQNIYYIQATLSYTYKDANGQEVSKIKQVYSYANLEDLGIDPISE